MSLYVEPAEQDPFDGIRRGVGEEMQAGITEIAEVPPPKKKQVPPWLYDLCVAFMGRDQWFKAWAGSHSKPSSWAGILIKLGLLGLTYKELSTRLCLPGPTQLVRLLNATCRHAQLREALLASVVGCGGPGPNAESCGGP